MKNFLPALLLLATITVSAQIAEPRYVEVTGRAETKVKPDVILYTVSYYDYSAVQSPEDFPSMTAGGKPAISVETAEKILLDIAKRNNIKPEKIVSDKYTIIAENNYTPGQLTYTFQLSDYSQLDKFIDQLKKENIFTASISSSQYSKYADAAKGLRGKAFEDAKANAQELAKLSGATLGKVLVIWDEPSTPAAAMPYPTYPYGDEGGYYPPVNADEISISAQVRVRFELN